VKLFVWDYHGTLEKGNELAALEISNLVLKKFGFTKRFTPQDGIDLYGRKWYQYFEYLLPNEPHETHIKLQAACFEWPEAEAITAKYIQPNDYVHEVLAAIQSKGHTQVILSNTVEAAMPIFIRLARLEAYFTAANAFAVAAHSREVKRTKIDILHHFIAALPEAPEKVILIGDSQADVELLSGDWVKGYWYRHPTLPLPTSNQPHITPINDLRTILAELR